MTKKPFLLVHERLYSSYAFNAGTSTNEIQWVFYFILFLRLNYVTFKKKKLSLLNSQQTNLKLEIWFAFIDLVEMIGSIVMRAHSTVFPSLGMEFVESRNTLFVFSVFLGATTTFSLSSLVKECWQIAYKLRRVWVN